MGTRAGGVAGECPPGRLGYGTWARGAGCSRFPITPAVASWIRVTKRARCEGKQAPRWSSLPAVLVGRVRTACRFRIRDTKGSPREALDRAESQGLQILERIEIVEIVHQWQGGEGGSREEGRRRGEGREGRKRVTRNIRRSGGSRPGRAQTLRGLRVRRTEGGRRCMVYES